jgi:hypothetical protein
MKDDELLLLEGLGFSDEVFEFFDEAFGLDFEDLAYFLFLLFNSHV